MKKSISLIFLWISLSSAGQLRITLQNLEGIPYQNILVYIINEKKDTINRSFSNGRGTVDIGIPTGKNYWIFPVNAPCPLSFRMPDTAYFQLTYTYPSHNPNISFATQHPVKQKPNYYKKIPNPISLQNRNANPLLELPVLWNFVGWDQKPLAHDTFWLTSSYYQIRMYGITDSLGNAYTWLPAEDTLILGFSWYPHYDHIYLPGSPASAFSFQYQAEGHKNIYYRKKTKSEREKLSLFIQPKKQIITPDTRLSLEKKLWNIRQKNKMPEDKGLLPLIESWIPGDSDLVVIDVTESMKFHLESWVWWFNELQRKEIKRVKFVLFNDGDGIQDKQKKIGSTGGVYCFHTHQTDTFIYYLIQAAFSGNGGDIPENDIEAMLAGIQWASQIKHIYLFADGLAPVKDISFLSKINRPVHVWLPGTFNSGIQTDYLYIAHQTRGSLRVGRQEWKKEADQIILRYTDKGYIHYQWLQGGFREWITDSWPKEIRH